MTALRPSWDVVWMETAMIIAKRSLCTRAQVGCVLVDAHNNVAAASYNGPPAGYDHRDNPCTYWCPRASSTSELVVADYSDCPSVHAEQNAVARSGAYAAGGTAYVSGSVCIACAKLLAAARVERVVHRVLASDEHRNPAKVELFLEYCGIEVVRWEA